MLSAVGLHLAFGRSVVLDGVDVELAAGTLTGLIGGNGSGKSTLLRVLCGLLRAQAGRILVDGIDPVIDPVGAKRRIGYAVAPEDLPAGLTGRQYLELVASVRDVPRKAWWAVGGSAPKDVVDTLAMENFLDTRLRACSLGTKAKFAIAAAMLGDPAWLVLDESLNGLDPLAAWRVRGMLRARVHAGRGVILASHALETVLGHCDRVIMLDGGAIAFDWSEAELVQARRDPAAFEAGIMQTLMERVRR